MVDLGVVMPVYKQKPEFLKAALESVLRQSYRGFKLIVVIDGAPEMEPLVKAYAGGDARVEVMPLAWNQGVANALNAGFKPLYKMKQIQYLTWVSSDNVYYPAFFETLRKALVKGPDELGLVYSSFQSIDNEDRPLHDELKLAELRQYQSKPKEKLLDSSIIGVSFMYKAKYAKMIDGYGLQPVEDYDYWLRLTEHCEIKYIPIELMDYRVNSTFSISSTLKTDAQHRYWRYRYHLARHMARSRRNIEPLVTVIYLVGGADDSTIGRLENLYEQAFSNYYCYVLDLSPDGQATALLSTISHPTTDFKPFPNETVNKALLYAVQMLRTKYTMVLGPALFPDPMDMEFLVAQLSKPNNAAALSSFYTEDRTDIQYRLPSGGPWKPNIYNELFRTEALLAILKSL
ncbi:Glycosyltransferase involved in cell wall bisynthesis [Cohnella sp. OV330]|uniref:glycosyltransferase family 2 protein n=1 Tax=Cohnella sp. OV330 TaxID=1855288 RepID=UPI0008E7BB24|nr:glycosyltransferase [Cohnella sp. OV330]SFA77812.1 Glycosyltransferase involved in cell wall bisynthesis [Cohnella sp. OV330]